MDKAKKILTIVIPILCIGILSLIVWQFYPAIIGTIKGESYYTYADIQNSYDKGYRDGNINETELKSKVEYYEEILNDYTISISTLNKQVALLTSQNESFVTEIDSLRLEKSNLEAQINDLKTDKKHNETEIIELNKTITSLNSQISESNTQILNLQEQINSNLKTISSLNSQISDMQETINYYEEYISTVESENQAVATFEYNNSIIGIQILSKGSKVSITIPEDTDYLIFNGWLVNGESVNLDTFVLNSNTKFVADLTYKYDVKFVVDGVDYNSQIITSGESATLPEQPVKNGYEFDGWTNDGFSIINPTSILVTSNTTFTAIFTKIHTVEFISENELQHTLSVRNNSIVSDIPEIESTTYKIFNGWLLDGELVDLDSFKVVSDTTFVADITYKYDVKFVVDGVDYNSQIITSGESATLPEQEPTKENYIFKGWSNDGISVIDITTVPILEDTTFTAIFFKLHTVTFLSQNNTVYTEKVQDTDISKYTETPVLTDWIFYGWSTTTSRDDIVNLSELNITEDITLNAIYKKSVFTWNNTKPLETTINISTTGYGDNPKAIFTINDYVNCSSLLNSGNEFSIDLTYSFAENSTNFTDSFDFEIKEQLTKIYYQYDLESGEIASGYLAFYLSDNNNITINSADGSNSFTLLRNGSHKFTIHDVIVYTY